MPLISPRRVVVLLPCLTLVFVLLLFAYQNRPRPQEELIFEKTRKPSRPQLPSLPQGQEQQGQQGQRQEQGQEGHSSFDGTWDYHRDRDNLLLSQEQCDLAFPGLFADIERARASREGRPITLQELDSITPKNGYVRAMIYDQQLYIIAKEGAIWSREIATLSAIHRALLTSPQPLPNIEFAFNADDSVDPVAIWGYARRAQDESIWLIPDFGYWSWPEPKIGSAKEVQDEAIWAEENEGLSWRKKNKKLLWRGVPGMGPAIRDKLLEVTAGQSWADVKALSWSDPDSKAHDYKTMPEHCKYRYVAQTEGNTYSGRLKYLQSCRSVVVSHELDWIQHHYHLMQSSGPEQNFVEVRRDWADLKEKIQWLQKHDGEARRIADNNVRMFRERYLTPAAEVCYWRRLFREWAGVSAFEPPFFKKVNGKREWRGLPVESYLLMRERDWEMA